MRSDADRFAVRMLAEVMADASASYWRRRAQTFRDARARPGDFLGNSTVEQRRARWRRLTEIAQACDARAEVALRHEQDRLEAEAAAAWSEVG